MKPNPKKYRSETFRFKTPDGYKDKLVVVLSGESERARLLKKAQKMASENGWIF